MRTAVAESSIQNFYAELHNGGLQLRERQILLAMKPNTNYTRLELSEASGITINNVAGRVNSLVAKGVLVEGEKRLCRISGRNVGTIRFPVPEKQGDLFA